ncbi:DUF1446 domain containing protein [Pyrenophora tritici-repentis]|nr:DUF1446 domain containing protein [Pyrenophora tritici-repentis]
MKQDPTKGYEPSFLRQLDHDTAHTVAKRGIKIVHDGGALNPKGLAQKCVELLQSYGINQLKVAYVEGDDVKGLLQTIAAPGYAPHLDIPDRDLSHIT